MVTLFVYPAFACYQNSAVESSRFVFFLSLARSRIPAWNLAKPASTNITMICNAAGDCIELLFASMFRTGG